jgi:hypothetical protein
MALTLLLLALLTRAAADASTRNAFHSHPWRGDGEPLPSAAALLDLRAPAPPFTLAACAIVRNKGPYLREVRLAALLNALLAVLTSDSPKQNHRNALQWVYYHWLLGFQHFWLYENESTDDTRAVLGTLVARGLVTLLDWPGPLGAQKRQLEHCFNASGPAGQTRWMGSFDADEFVAVLNHDPRQSPLLNSSLTFALHDHLQRFSDSGKRVGAISLDRSAQ